MLGDPPTAGGVLIGKTSVGALAFGDIWYGGQTRNPWNTEEGSRGSSAGSAAATAAGLAGFALGTETLGSIVAPCARCGTVGLRPTFGRVSRAGAMSLCWSLHFPNGLVPGDGMHIVMPLLLGMNRGRYFLLTGQTLSAQEAKDLGLVAEVLPQDKVLARAWEHAEALASKPTLLLRYTRLMFTEYLKKRMQDLLGYGLAMEGLALMEQIDRPK